MAPALSRLLWAGIRLPFDLTIFFSSLTLSIIPAFRPCPEWTFKQTFGVKLLQMLVMYFAILDSGNKLSLEPGKEGERFTIAMQGDEKMYQAPLDDEKVRPGKVGMTWYKGVPTAQEIASEGFSMVLHFHGGAYTLGDGRDKDMGFLSRTLLKELGVSNVCCPQYRLASPSGPDHFPAAVQDAVTIWLHLTRTLNIPASKIIFSGDSAGGNLALALLRYIHDYEAQLDLPAPGGVALWSPWIDVHDAVHTEVSTKANHKTDYVSTPFSKWGSHSYTKNATIDPKHPYISPLHSPFYSEVFAKTPMFVQTCDLEVLYYDNVALMEKMEKAGWTIGRDIVKNAPHDIMALGHVIGFVKEARGTTARAREFFKETTDLRFEK